MSTCMQDRVRDCVHSQNKLGTSAQNFLWVDQRGKFQKWLYSQVDAVEFYKERIQALADAITKGSEHPLRDPESTLPAAFVTFKTRTAQVLHCSLALGGVCAACARPR